MEKSKFFFKVTLGLLVYVLATRAIFITAVFYKNLSVALTVPTIIAGISGFLFLYFLLHEEKFKFIRIIREKKRRTEEKLIHKFIKFGRFLTCLIIGLIAGPLFAAMSVAILLSDFRYKYLYVIIISTLSILTALCISRGLIDIFI